MLEKEYRNKNPVDEDGNMTGTNDSVLKGKGDVAGGGDADAASEI